MNQSKPVFDRMVKAIAKIVRASLPNTDYLAQYSCTVQGQNSDNSLELKPDKIFLLPTFSKVQIRTTVPGLKFTVSQGARCVIFFPNGLRAPPVASCWEQPGLVTLDLASSSEVSIAAPAVNLGQKNATDALVRGTTYRQAEDTLFAQLNLELAAAGAALTSAGGAATFTLAAPFLATAGSSLAALAAAFSAFQATEAQYLSTIVKTS